MSMGKLVVFVLVAFLSCASLALGAEVPFTEHVISTGGDGVFSVFATDVDGDGDIDVLSASMSDDKIAWYESDGGLPPTFTEHVISTTADRAVSVFATDVDGDGDIDVLSASVLDDKIAWYESDGGSPPAFTERVISTAAVGAYYVFATDVDGDGDTDVISASWQDGKIAWYDSNGGSPPTFTERVISTAAGGANFVFATDVDGDGDTDVLSASDNDKIAWYESDGGSPPSFTERVISTTSDGPRSVFAADVDGDGDIDVLSASIDDDKIAWYDNDGGSPPTFTEHVISTTADRAASVFATDVDGDGDIDVLSASIDDDKIAWYENDGGSPPTFTERVISTTADAAHSVFATDLDGDGDIDVLSASIDDDKIAWYENTTTPCGDGVLDPGEECDDGNTGDGDGCSSTCTVEIGYTCDASEPSVCADHDECALGASNCGANAACTNTPGSFTCACDSGFSGDGYTCTDDDECTLDYTLDYTLRESIAIPAEMTHVRAVGDMDGDAVLDVVLSGGNTIVIRERDGSTFVNRFTNTEPNQLRACVVAEVDGDGLPEVLSSNRSGRAQIWEASGDNVYALRHTEIVGNFIERSTAGDSDGDGQREFLIARESFPSEVIILEATSDNVYVKQSTLTGSGGNNNLAGTFDLDGDGAPETVFGDDSYSAVLSLYVYENGSLIFQDNQMANEPLIWRGLGIGDTDGNGLGEIVGYEAGTGYLRILESTGNSNGFVEVFNGPDNGYNVRVLDVDDDGRAEFWRSLDDGSGLFNTFTLATRTGSAITDIYNSGSLLKASSDPIRDILAIGDTNGDGNRELAVVQGDQIHILELSSSGCDVNATCTNAPGSFTCTCNSGYGTSHFMQKITAPDGAAGDSFGWSVSIDGDWAIVGAQWDDDDGDKSGSAYIYRLTAGVWEFEKKLTADDAELNDWFGASVSISGDVAMVGVYRDDDACPTSANCDSGSTSVFQRDQGGADNWGQLAKLTAADAQAADSFGGSVSVSGDVAIIGAAGDDDRGNGAGSAYTFRLVSGVWTQKQKLTASDGTGNDHFGAAVSVSGDVAIVGAWGDYTGSIQWTGSAYVFRYSPDTETWLEEQKLVLPDPKKYQFFGGAVSIDGDLAIVGNRNDGGGAAYVYRFVTGLWILEEKLTASDGATNDWFGGSVSISGEVAIMGAYGNDDIGPQSGSSYVFHRQAASWPQEDKLIAPDREAGDEFGRSVSVDGGLALLGAQYDDDACPDNPDCDSGAAYFYTIGSACTDIDECTLRTDHCDLRATCANTSGSYACTCNPGYSGDGVAGEGGALFSNSGQSLGDAFTWHTLLGDIDNDGDEDIVSLEDGFNMVHIYFNHGNGVFSSSSPQSFQRTTGHRSGALADLDGDGNLDLVIGGDGSAAGVSIYSGDGTGGFTETWSYTWSFAQIDAVNVGDIDGNGSLDLVAVGYISDEGSIQLFLNDGPDTYLRSAISLSAEYSQATDAVLADFDNDLALDLAVSFESFFDVSGIEVFLNNSGSLASTGQSVTAPYPYGLDAGDLDGDGDIDLAIGNQASVPNQVMFNDGTGTFADSGQSLGAEATNDVVLGDIDRDGDLDLVAINEGHGGRGYVVYRNDGLGVFSEQEFGSNNFKRTGTLGDVDGDGDLDLVTGDYRTGASNNHAPDQILINTPGCVADDDGCASGTDNCDVNATCTSTPGSFTCACNTGYSGDGVTCSDDDECALGTNDCDVNATCANVPGSFTCTCNSGYTGDGVTCTGDDECSSGSHNCDVNAACTDTPSGFTCTCDAGFAGDGVTCSDEDECIVGTDNCDVNANCTNTLGGFTCSCYAGHSGDGVSCTDVNECTSGTDNCDTDAICTNSPGSFSCACRSGYSGDGVTCIDDDECTLMTDNCDANATCANTPGSFTCACRAGYDGDGVTCTDEDECIVGTDNCDVNANCTNTPGSFTCTCDAGYSGDGVTGAGDGDVFTDSGQELGDGRTLLVLAGDIDNDGDQDIISLEDVPHVLEGTADIYLNEGTGEFGLLSGATFLTTTLRPYAGELADVNGDGNLDLLVGGDKGTSATLAGGLALYLGDGTGGFTETWSDSLAAYAQVDAVEVGDVDGNGSLDFVAVGYVSGSESIQVCLNAGVNAYLCGPVVSDIGFAQDAVLVDLDNDNDLDLAVASVSFEPGGSSEIQILLNNAGVLTSTGHSVAASYPYGLDAEDLDGDGDVDLAVGNQASYPNQVLFNDGTGRFTDSGQALGGEATNSVVLGDIDLDGDVDLIAINEGHGGRGYVLYSNDGSGGFTEQEFGSGNFKRNGTLVDVDGDGDLDLVTGDYSRSANITNAPNQVLINNRALGCIDEDECTLGTDACDVNATCANVPGSFTCTCNVDYEGDGLACTLIDACPGDPDKTDPGVCGCGVPDLDSDGDGAFDCVDPCPNANPDDSDGDGVCGDVDNCPANANVAQADSDLDGAGDACDVCPLDAGDDSDGDGICGDVDNCPASANVAQADSDFDGAGDACDVCPLDADDDADDDGICGDVDNCPAVSNGSQADVDLDGIGDLCDACPLDGDNDGDGDGVCGDVDNCPSSANAAQTDSDLDGAGDVCDVCPLDAADDADGDGVCGDVDNCPAVANGSQLDSDGDGAGDGCDICPCDPDNDIDGDGVCGDVDSCPLISVEVTATLTYSGDMLVPIDASGLAAVSLSGVLTDEADAALAGVPVTFTVTDSLGGFGGECAATTGARGQVACLLNLTPDVYAVSVESAQGGCPLAMDESLLVVFDPNVPRATGGGFILPDAESTLPGASPRDKANFGFIVRIDNNQAAAGNLEFQYKAAGINLKSFDMTWYTVSNNSAMFQGEATINGDGLFTFRVRATDGDKTGDQPDAFDITIWAGTDTEAGPVHRAKNDLAGGSVVIHRR